MAKIAAPVIVGILGIALTLNCTSCSDPALAASPAALNCTTPTVFRGADDGSQSFAVDTVCTAVNIPANASTFVSAEATYQLQNSYPVSEITTWLGTAQNSIEETAGEITLEVPTAAAGVYKTVAIITNQKDKHQDVEGERIEHFVNGTYHLPAGSRIHFFMNMGVIDPGTNCPLGCAVQLNVYMNAPAS